MTDQAKKAPGFTTRWVPQQRVAFPFIREHHRHHRPPQGSIVAVGLFVGDDMVGVATIGRPVARKLDDGRTVEITRLCVLPTARHAASFLIGRCRRVAQALGFARLLTYTLVSEGGASLRAAGLTNEGTAGGGEWGCPARPRDAASFPTEAKTRWAESLDVPPPKMIAA